MKKLFFNSLFVIAIVMIFSICGYGQQDWNTLGNNLGAPGIFGSNTNFEVLFRTNGINRMKLMQSGNSAINGFNIDRSGFLGLSQDPNFFTGGVASPFSLLHLNGDNNGGAAQQLGYRPWMQYGITFTHNRDLMYVGPRRTDDSANTSNDFLI